MLRVFEAFSGVGAQRMALRNLGIEHEVVGVSEIDIPAINSYAAIHEDLLGNDDFNYPSKEEMIEYLASKHIGLDVKTGQVKLPKQIDKLQLIYKASVLSKCVGDISIIDPHDLPDMDLFTYSFPCQDLSVAGQRAGMIKGQTRSGLLYECEKIIEVKRPKYLLLENVKNLVGSKFRPSFEEWLAYLETLGYTNYWKVLNAKDYGVPQNRERVFVVSILGEHKTYSFPTPIPLTRAVEDILEDEVEERFYVNLPLRLSPDYLEQAKPAVLRQERTTYGKAIRKQYEAGLIQEKRSNMREFKPRPDGLSNTLTTVQKDNYLVEPKILVNYLLPNQDISYCIDANYHKGTTIEGYLTKRRRQLVNDKNNYRVRKLTPLECWRLMGFSDDDFNKAKSAGLSNSQLYKQAGNSIVVPVLEGIFEQLINNTKEREVR